jgi:hypothetical protein
MAKFDPQTGFLETKEFGKICPIAVTQMLLNNRISPEKARELYEQLAKSPNREIAELAKKILGKK